MKELLRSYKKEWFSIPNILSYFRILTIPVYMYLYIAAKNEKWYFAATIILIISGITDALDGFIARKFNMITEWGKLVDPLADKLTQFAVVISLMFRYNQILILVVLFIIKESIMAAGCYIIYRRHKKKMNGAKWYGKINTIVFYGVTISLVLFYSMPIYLVDLLIIISIIFMLFTAIMYTKLFFEMDKCKELN